MQVLKSFNIYCEIHLDLNLVLSNETGKYSQKIAEHERKCLEIQLGSELNNFLFYL